MPSRHHAPLAVGLLFVLMGLLVGTGGVWLIALGGSWFYLPGGLALVLIGLLLLQRSPAALWVHAALLSVTLAWSVWEAGLDWWAMAARGDVLFVLGLVMLTPWFTRGLEAAARPGARQALSVALGAFAAVAVMSWFHGAPDVGQRPFAQVESGGIVSAAHATHSTHARQHVLNGSLSHPLATAAPIAYQAAEMTTHSPMRTADLRTADALPPSMTTPFGTGTGSPKLLSGADMWGVTLFDHLMCRIAFQRLRFDDRFTPAVPPSAHLRQNPSGRLQEPDHRAAPQPGMLQVRSTEAAAASAELWPGPAHSATLGPAWAVDRVSHAVHQQPLLSPLGLPCQMPHAGIGSALYGPPAAPPPSRARPMAHHVPETLHDMVVHTEDPATPQPPGRQSGPDLQTLPKV